MVGKVSSGVLKASCFAPPAFVVGVYGNNRRTSDLVKNLFGVLEFRKKEQGKIAFAKYSTFYKGNADPFETQRYPTCKGLSKDERRIRNGGMQAQ